MIPNRVLVMFFLHLGTFDVLQLDTQYLKRNIFQHAVILKIHMLRITSIYKLIPWKLGMLLQQFAYICVNAEGCILFNPCGAQERLSYPTFLMVVLTTRSPKSS